MKSEKNFWLDLPRPILALAPMCGVTDLAFRTICRQHGADLVYSEMIMVQALARKGKKVLKLAEISAAEQPVIIQLGGNDPELFYQAARVAAELGPAGIDINFGCPAKKVAGHGSGIALLRDLEKSFQIVQATIEGAGGLPVSIKTRSQIKSADKKQIITSLALLEKLKPLPVACVMVHGRSYEAPWVENVDYEYIRQVKQSFSGLVLANGGVYSVAQAKTALDISQADGLGIGHGVYGQPWFFQQIKDYLATGHYQELTWPEKRQIALAHARLAFATKSDHGLIELRKQLLWYVKGLPQATDYRQTLVRLKTLSEIEQALEAIN